MSAPGTEGRTVVITGASAGIGAAAAAMFAAAGDRVVVVGRSPERTRAVAASIGGTALLADFEDLDSVRALAADLLASCPRIEILANNAGGVAGAIYHLTDQWKIVPAMKKYKGELSFSYVLKTGSKGDAASQPAADLLANGKRSFTPRSKIASLMHDKFIVGFNSGTPSAI